MNTTPVLIIDSKIEVVIVVVFVKVLGVIDCWCEMVGWRDRMSVNEELLYKILSNAAVGLLNNCRG